MWFHLHVGGKLVFHWVFNQQPSILGSLKVKGDFSDRATADSPGCHRAPSVLSSSPGWYKEGSSLPSAPHSRSAGIESGLSWAAQNNRVAHQQCGFMLLCRSIFVQCG